MCFKTHTVCIMKALKHYRSKGRHTYYYYYYYYYYYSYYYYYYYY